MNSLKVVMIDAVFEDMFLSIAVSTGKRVNNSTPCTRYRIHVLW